MPIHMYEEWIKESEKVDPSVPEPTATPAPIQPAGVESIPATTDTTSDIETGLETPPAEETELSEQEEFEQIDTTRRAAITAFKDKQKEYMEIPKEIRNNPTSDEDKTKVESLKADLQNLNTAMKDAVTAYDEFNDKMLGSSIEGDIEP